MQGDRDLLYPIDISIEMYKAIPDSSLWITPNAGHVPIASHMDDFIQAATKFLK